MKEHYCVIGGVPTRELQGKWVARGFFGGRDMTSSGSGSKTSQILGTAVIYQTTKKTS